MNLYEYNFLEKFSNLFDKWDAGVDGRDSSLLSIFKPWKWFGIRTLTHSIFFNPILLMAVFVYGWMFSDEMLNILLGWLFGAEYFTTHSWTTEVLFQNYLMGSGLGFLVIPLVIFYPIFITGLFLEPVLWVMNKMIKRYYLYLGIPFYNDFFFVERFFTDKEVMKRDKFWAKYEN